MKRVARLLWIARFDMEDLTSSLLRNGTLISLGLVVASLLAGRLAKMPGTSEMNLAARSLPLLIWTDLQRMGSPGFWPRFLLDLAVATLLLTPYARVLASMGYFAVVERSWKHALFQGATLLILTVLLLTPFL